MADDTYCSAHRSKLRCTKRPHSRGLHLAIDGDTVVWWGPLPVPPGGASDPAGTPPPASPSSQRQVRPSTDEVPAPDMVPIVMSPPPTKGPSPYTGDACVHCGSLRVIQDGTCGTCQDCGSSTGCG